MLYSIIRSTSIGIVQELKKTEQARAENSFLLAEHSVTEEALHEEAQQLMSAVKLGVSDVHGLHAKLDRKKMVEKHNHQTTEGFKQVHTYGRFMARKLIKFYRILLI